MKWLRTKWQEGGKKSFSMLSVCAEAEGDKKCQMDLNPGLETAGVRQGKSVEVGTFSAPRTTTDGRTRTCQETPKEAFQDN